MHHAYIRSQLFHKHFRILLYVIFCLKNPKYYLYPILHHICIGFQIIYTNTILPPTLLVFHHIYFFNLVQHHLNIGFQLFAHYITFIMLSVKVYYLLHLKLLGQHHILSKFEPNHMNLFFIVHILTMSYHLYLLN